MEKKKIKSNLARFKDFYKNPKFEDYIYFKKLIKLEKSLESSLKDLMHNLDFEYIDEHTIAIVENEINFDALHPLIQEMINNYFDYINSIE